MLSKILGDMAKEPNHPLNDLPAKRRTQAYETVLAAFEAKDNGLLQDVDEFDDILGDAHQKGHTAADMPYGLAKRIGISLLHKQAPETIRLAALESQARCIETGDDVESKTLAARLRGLGPSPEALAYGLDMTRRYAPFDLTSDRMIAESAPLYLAAIPGADRAALECINGRTPSMIPENRYSATLDHFAGRNHNEVIDAARASQALLADELAFRPDATRGQRITALALGRAINETGSSGLVGTQERINELANWTGKGPEVIPGTHPLAVISVVSSGMIALQNERQEKLSSKSEASAER